MKHAFILLFTGLATLAQSQTNQSVSLNAAIRLFGQGKYAAAASQLERFREKHPEDRQLVTFYLGECYYQLQDYSRAYDVFVEGTFGFLNRQEIYWRLVSLAQLKHDAQMLEGYKREFDAINATLATDSPHLTAERIRKAGKKVAITPLVSTPYGYHSGRGFMSIEEYDDAVKCFEHGLSYNVPLERRFTSEDARLFYQALLEAHGHQAPRLKKKRAPTADIQFAEASATNNALKLLIVESRLGTNSSSREATLEGVLPK